LRSCVGHTGGLDFSKPGGHLTNDSIRGFPHTNTSLMHKGYFQRGTIVRFKPSSTITDTFKRVRAGRRRLSERFENSQMSLPGLLDFWVHWNLFLKIFSHTCSSLSFHVKRKSMGTLSFSHCVMLALVGQFCSSKDLLFLSFVCLSDHLLSLFRLLLFFNPWLL